jgi:hypothetical protein
MGEMSGPRFYEKRLDRAEECAICGRVLHSGQMAYVREEDPEEDEGNEQESEDVYDPPKRIACSPECVRSAESDYWELQAWWRDLEERLEPDHSRDQVPATTASTGGYQRFQAALLSAVQERFVPALETPAAAIPPRVPDWLQGAVQADAARKAARARTKLGMLERNQEAAVVLGNRLFGREGPTSLKRTLSPEERFLALAFQGFSEIDCSVQALEDIAFYVGRFPFRNTRIAPERYLQFNVETYWAEVYILRERLIKYVKVLDRLYKTDPALVTYRKHSKTLLDAILASLEGSSTIRNAHVHQHRFTDRDIERLGMIALLARHGGAKIATTMSHYFRVEYGEIRRRWKERIVVQNQNVRVLVDGVFARLHALMFDPKTETVRLPRGVSRQQTARLPRP